MTINTLPNKIRAAVLYQIDKPLQILDLELPKLEVGQVLVKIFYSGVCRSQLMEARGGRGKDPWLPHMLGHEGSGVVVAIGKGVNKVQPGDQVILSWIRGDGIEAEGARYKSGNQVINSGHVTTFCNYSIASENRVIKKPLGLSFDEAILFGCALPTGAGIILNEMQPPTSASVIILGLGGIGLSALMALKASGIKNLIALDVSETKITMAKSLGALHALNTSNDNFLNEFNDILPEGADYCIESAGHASTIELGFSLIKKKSGELVFASHPHEGKMICLSPHELIAGKKISGSWGGSTNPDKDIGLMYDKFKNAKIPLSSLITKRYQLDQINEALDDLESGRVFRPLIDMNHSDSE